MTRRMQRFLTSLGSLSTSLVVLALATPLNAVGSAANVAGASCTNVNWGAQSCNECEEGCADPFECDFYCGQFIPGWGFVCTCQNE